MGWRRACSALGLEKMTATQKFKRVLLSRWGFLTLVLLVLTPYLQSLLPEARPNDRVLIWMKIGVFLTPIAALLFGWVHFEGQDYEKRLAENPEEERGEDLISFLYEDEDAGKR